MTTESKPLTARSSRTTSPVAGTPIKKDGCAPNQGVVDSPIWGAKATARKSTITNRSVSTSQARGQLPRKIRPTPAKMSSNGHRFAMTHRFSAGM